ncbi:MAG: ATP-binding protein, partial [Thermoplasmatota archaeon]
EAKTAAAVAGKASETATAHLAEARRAAETYQQTEQALQVARAEADHATRQLKAEEERAHEAATAAKEAASLEPAAAKRTEAERHLQEARAAHEAHRRHQEAEARLVKQQQEAEALAKTVPPAPVGLAEAQVAADQARQRQAKADEAVALARQEAGRLEAQLTRLRSLGRDGPCPTCTRPLHDHLDDLLANAGAEHAAAVTAAEARGREAAQAAEARQKADAALQALQAEQQKHDAAKARSAAATAALEAARDLVGPAPPLPPDLSPLETELTTAQKAHDAWQRALSRAQGARPEALASARSRVESALAKQRRAQSDLDRRPDPAPALRQAEGDEAEARRRHREAERLGAEATTALGRAEERADSARLRLEEEQARRRKARELRGELRYWTALVDPRRQGLLERFRDHLVARVGPAVSAEASHLLARFTQGRYTEVVLDADYRLLVADGGILHPVERFSGGETDLVHLALRLGVSRLLAGRSGQAELRFLALDEVFGSLDAERRRAVVGALDGLKGLYAQILVITHLEDLRDGLDHVLEVQGEASGDAVVRLD